MRIDVHNHVFPSSTIDLLSSNDAFGMEINDGRIVGGFMNGLALTDAFHSVPAKLADLQRIGLDGAVVSPVPSLFCYDLDVSLGETVARETNRGLADLCREAECCLRWMATLPMQDVGRAVRVLEQAIDSGCVGVEIGASIAGQPLDEAVFVPFWELVEERSLPVMIHPATGPVNRGLNEFHLRNVVGHLFETTIAVERLICAGVLERHPGIRLILVHGGGAFPYVAGRLRHAAAVRRELEGTAREPWSYVGQVVFDSLTHDADALAYLVAKAGAGNVLLGTDLPFDMASREPFDALVAALGQDDARVIAEDNPQRLFQFPA